MEKLKFALQAIVIIPILMLVSYVGFWLTIISGPLIVGLIFFGIAYWVITDYAAYKKEQEMWSDDDD